MEKERLVRDKLEQMILSNYPTAFFKRVAGIEYKKTLERKLHEEITEFIEASSKEVIIEETSDVLDVIESILTLSKISWEEVIRIKQKKQEQRRSFRQGIIWQKNL